MTIHSGVENIFLPLGTEAKGRLSKWQNGSLKNRLQMDHMNNKIRIEWQWTPEHACRMVLVKPAFVQICAAYVANLFGCFNIIKGWSFEFIIGSFSCLYKNYLWKGNCYWPSQDYPEYRVWSLPLSHSSQKRGKLAKHFWPCSKKVQMVMRFCLYFAVLVVF